MERDKIDLIDTRGRKTLIDTRKRRRDSVLITSHDGARSLSPEPPSKLRRPKTDLGKLLRPAQLPSSKYHAIQSVLFEQDKIMSGQEKKIGQQFTRICDLKEELSRANARIDRDQEKLENKADQIVTLEKQLVNAKGEQYRVAEESRKRKRYFEGVTDDQEDLIKVGRKVLHTQNQKTERLAEENQQLRVTISNRDRTISSLNAQIVRMSKAAGDEISRIALEAQAQRTLGMVKGLKKDIAESDRAIEEYKAKNDSLATAQNQLKTENARLRSKCAESENALKAFEKRAAESKAILEDQNALIDRLMKGNAGLLEANEKMK